MFLILKSPRINLGHFSFVKRKTSLELFAETVLEILEERAILMFIQGQRSRPTSMTEGHKSLPPPYVYMYHVWNCPNCYRDITSKNYFREFNQCQRSRTMVDIKDHCHLYRYTLAKFEVVGPNHSWDMARMSYFHVLYDWTM